MRIGSQFFRFPARPSVVALALLTASLLMPGTSQAASRTLPDRTWQLLVLPGDGAVKSIAELFGSALPIDDYNRTWTIYVPDDGGDGYRQPAPNERLATGAAFWIIQQTGNDVTVDVSLPPPDGLLSPACTSSAGCVTLPLAAQPNAVSWSAVGVPLDASTLVAGLRLVATSGPCSDGCDLQEAADAGLSGGALWTLDASSNTYRQLGLDDTLAPWEGFWISLQTGATLIGNVQLVVPLGEPDLAYCP